MNVHTRTLPLILTLAVLIAAAPAQTQTPAPAPVTSPEAYETPAGFSASQYLPAEWLAGPHHRVRDSAQSDGLMIHYTVDSDFGIYYCAGTRDLKRCVNEISAIAKLVEVSKGDMFAEGLKRSVEAPVEAVKNIVGDPAGSVEEAPSTFRHLFSKVDAAVEKTRKRVGRGIAGEGWRDPYAGSKVGDSLKNLVGFQRAKLDTARQLGVDPYSDNARLQEEIEKVTWAFFAGGLPLRIGAAAASGGASVVALGATMTIGLPEEIYKLTPAELSLRDSQAMAAMGINQAAIDSVILNRGISISSRHRVISSLETLPAGPGRAEVIRVLAASSDAHRARMLADILELLAARHSANPYRSIEVKERLPIGVLADGSIEVVAPIDYLSWTPLVKEFVARQDFGGGVKRLVISCKISSLATDRLSAAGWTIVPPTD